MGATQQILIAIGGASGGSGTTWDPANKGASVSLSGGNLTASNSTNDFNNVKATVQKTSGKWYWEVTVDTLAAAGDCFLGIGRPSYDNTARVVLDSDCAFLRSDGTQYKNGSTSGSAFTYVATNVLMFAWDADGEQIWFGKNGTWHAGGDPGAGTGAQLTGLSTASMTPVFGPDNDVGTTTVTAKFAAPFAYSVPSGFSALA